MRNPVVNPLRNGPSTSRMTSQRAPPNNQLFNAGVGRGMLHGLQTSALCTEHPYGVGSSRFRDCFRPAFATLWSKASDRARQKRVQAGAPADDLCAKPRALHRDQMRLYETAKYIAYGGSNDRGQLVWANTGAGKTLMALCILLAYWDTGRRLVVISTPANMAQNNPKKYTENLVEFFPEVARRLEEVHGPGWKSKLFRRHDTVADNSAKVLFYTQEKFINFATKAYGAHRKISEGEWVLILDEAHQLLEPPSAPEALRTAMLALKDKLLSKQFAIKKIHVYAMTATPASSVGQWMDMLSFVRSAETSTAPSRVFNSATRLRPLETALSAQATLSPSSQSDAGITAAINNYARGKVFFSDLRADLRVHACVSLKYAEVTLDKWYYVVAMQVVHQKLQEERSGTGSIGESGRASMFLHKTEYGKLLPVPIQQELAAKGLLIGDKWVSRKLVKIARDIADVGANPGKVFVYSPHFPTGTSDAVIQVLGKALEKWYGFNDVTKKVLNKTQWTNPTRDPCFVLWGRQAPREPKVARPRRGGEAVDPMRNAVLADVNPIMSNKAKLAKAFNASNNKDGRHIKVYLACGLEYEGTDLQGLRHLHVTEPMMSPLRERQLLGRGVRYCAHAGTTPRLRVVQWFATPPPRSQPIGPVYGQIRSRDVESMKLVVEDMAARYPRGPDLDLWDRYMTQPGAVNLYNFELYLKKVADPRMKSAYQKRFYPLPGRSCS